MALDEGEAEYGLKARDVYSVTEITEALRQSLESEFPSVMVSGEIANFKAHTSGHYYFTLRDRMNLLRAVMFRRNTYRLPFAPENGMQVIATGTVSHYGASGQTQLIAETMMEEGDGRIELEVRRILLRLSEEGLTDSARKRPLPAYPERIAVLTSATGAVIRDIRRTIERRWPVAELLHFQCEVQGSSAASSIVEAFGSLERSGENIDLVILARGGGSVEDLRAFNTEEAARAVAGCRYPVVTGIGHEIDTTVCDHVSDLRAATPTAAAELATPSIGDVKMSIAELGSRMHRAWRSGSVDRYGAVEYLLRSSVFPSLRHRMETSEMRLADRTERISALCGGRVEAAATALDRYDARMLRAVEASHAMASRRHSRSVELLSSKSPAADLASAEGRLGTSLAVLRRSASGRLRLALSEAEGILRSLEGLCPLAVLKRGYSFCVSEATGDIIGGVDDLGVGDGIRVNFHDGDASCKVTSKRKEK